MKETLILYFSRKGNNYYKGSIVDLKKGNTKVFAEKVHNLNDADLFEIKTVKQYALDYYECTEESKTEMHENARPELVAYPNSIEQYDSIILAYPNWWNTMPMAVWTLLEQFDFLNKHIYPVCTHEGSGLGNSVSDIKKLCPNAIVETGLALKGSQVENSDNQIQTWLKERGLM